MMAHDDTGRALSASSLVRETPDVETASDDYARRFTGAAGQFFLRVQTNALKCLIGDLQGASVLEVGGGHAQLVPTFLDYGCRLTILGSTDDTHARVRRLYPDAGITLDSGDLLSLPYPDRSFDAVVAVRLVAHVEAWERLLSELCRVARRAVIVDYASWRSLNVLTPLLFRLKKSIEKDTRVYTSFRPWQLANAFDQQGFAVTDSYGQFFLPMFIHRALSGASLLRRAEGAFRSAGLTSVLGSPVLLRADRRPEAGGARPNALLSSRLPE
ncbi:MAG: class I SAM-dependent methyltransferase [Gammaproteobacteria bacterium]|nr:class I SAM-dependent methyltransferase [Gammaproteobacteria bacterium]